MKKSVKKEFFRMLCNLTSRRYLCFHKHRRKNFQAYLNIPVKPSFLWKRIQQSSLIIEMKTQKNLKGVQRMEVLIAFHVNFFLCNKYNSYNILLKIQK